MHCAETPYDAADEFSSARRGRTTSKRARTVSRAQFGCAAPNCAKRKTLFRTRGKQKTALRYSTLLWQTPDGWAASERTTPTVNVSGLAENTSGKR